MATLAEVAEHRAANRGIVAAATRDLNRFWATLDLADPAGARDALLRFMPALTTQYGEIAATVAADWYDDLRASAGAPGRFTAQVAEAAPSAAIEAKTRFGAQHLWTPTPEQSLAFLASGLSKYVLQPGRDTIVSSVRRDSAKPRWARVPSGRRTCAFCLVMASRGFVYHSDASAGRAKKFHGRCDCTIVPDWSDDPRVEGYDPDRLYGLYSEARAEAGKASLDGAGNIADDDLSILQALRRLHPDLVTDGVVPATH